VPAVFFHSGFSSLKIVDQPSSDGSFNASSGDPFSEGPGSAPVDFSLAGDTPVHPFVSQRQPGVWARALAGLHAGILGVFGMFACFAIAALWNRQGLWMIPNLFSMAFYGSDAYWGQFLHTTWAGLAFLIAFYGLLGAVWGCFWKRRKAGILLYGALAGLATYYIFFGYVFPHTLPLIPLYAPTRELQAAHIVWGAMLAKSPDYSRRINELSGSASLSTYPEDAAERVRGEVIQ
jgi:hypothetical protein